MCYRLTQSYSSKLQSYGKSLEKANEKEEMSS